MERKFELGKLVVTRGVHDLMEVDERFMSFVQRSLGRHVNCDWGELDESDKKQNDGALKNADARLFSAYKYSRIPDGKIWIITEWDRSATTILFPSEY